jgi:hypothetical protein
MSDCKVYRREIVEGFDGEMSRGAHAHAEVCRACGDELRGRESLRALVGGLAKVEAPSDFEFRLRARMAGSGAAGRRGPLKGLRLVYAFAPVAAAACFLVISTALYLGQASRTGAGESSSVAVAESARNATAGQTAAAPAVGDVKESGRTNVGAVSVAPASVTPPSRPAAQRQRAASRQSREVAAKLDGRAAAPQRNTADFSVTQAPVITGRGVTIALKTTTEPMRMILRDERGAGRVVPMRAVSFGAQELIARESVSRQATAAENEGVW